MKRIMNLLRNHGLDFSLSSLDISELKRRIILISAVLIGITMNNTARSQSLAFYGDVMSEHTMHALRHKGKAKEVSSFTYGTGFSEKSDVEIKGYRCKLGAGFPIIDDVYLLGMGICFGSKQYYYVNGNLDYLSSGRFFNYYPMGKELSLRQFGLNMKLENVGDWDSFFFGLGLDYNRSFFESAYKDEMVSGKGRTWSPDLKIGWRIPGDSDFAAKIFFDLAYQNILVQNIDWRSGDKVINDFSGFRSNYWQLTLGLGFEFNDWR
jgi:hypothetical protein